MQTEEFNPQCPYLGSIKGTTIDRTVRLHAPSMRAVCLSSMKHDRPSFDHQGHFCLSDMYSNCPRFIKAKARAIIVRASIASIIVISLIAGSYFYISKGKEWLGKYASEIPIIAVSSPTPTSEVRPTPSPSDTPMAATQTPGLPSPTPTMTPTPTLTAQDVNSNQYEVRGIRYWLHPDRARLVIDLQAIKPSAGVPVYIIDEHSEAGMVITVPYEGTPKRMKPSDRIVDQIVVSTPKPGLTRIEIALNRQVSFKYYLLHNPERMVFDFYTD